jgi:sporulation protein YlmC with PRC-barrel domain
VRARGETWHRPKPSLASVVEADRPPVEHSLIAAARVTNTPVYDANGVRLGRLAELAIDEATGSVVHVLVATGGFLGFGERLRRIPWRKLSYDPRRGGYIATGVDAAAPTTDVLRPITWSRPLDKGGWTRGL